MGSTVKLCAWTTVLLCVQLSHTFVQALGPPCQGACQIQVKCSNEEAVVWATDGRSCYVYRNACHLLNENCQRQNNCERKLATVSRAQCQPLCPQICPALYSPVCAEYNGARRMFPNRCELNAYICKSGQVWSLFSQGPC